MGGRATPDKRLQLKSMLVCQDLKKEVRKVKYHHLGIPTNEIQPEETYLENFKFFCTDHENNPFGIQWMRFEADCILPEIVKTVPHVAFEVENLEQALIGHEIIIEPNSPSDGVLVAFVMCNGAPVEFLEFEKR